MGVKPWWSRSEESFAAFQKPKETKDKPTVILAQTIKGCGMGETAEGKNIAHQNEKMNMDGAKHFRDRFQYPLLGDEKVAELPYITFDKRFRRVQISACSPSELEGYLPARRTRFDEKLEIPTLEDFSQLLEEQSKEISTTIAFVRALNVMLKTNLLKIV